MFHHTGLSKGDLSGQQSLAASLSALPEKEIGGAELRGAQHVLQFTVRHTVGWGRWRRLI